MKEVRTQHMVKRKRRAASKALRLPKRGRLQPFGGAGVAGGGGRSCVVQSPQESGHDNTGRRTEGRRAGCSGTRRTDEGRRKAAGSAVFGRAEDTGWVAVCRVPPLPAVCPTVTWPGRTGREARRVGGNKRGKYTYVVVAVPAHVAHGKRAGGEAGSGGCEASKHRRAQC